VQGILSEACDKVGDACMRVEQEQLPDNYGELQVERKEQVYYLEDYND